MKVEHSPDLPAAKASLKTAAPWLAGASLDSIGITVFGSFAEAEAVWRAAQADCACFGFQTFEWLSAWQETIGAAEHVEPYIVHLADGNGRTLMLLPLGIRRRHGFRLLGFLGHTVSDYHAPLIRADFAAGLDPHGLAVILRRVARLLPPADLIAFDKMPEQIADSPNPFIRLPGASHEWNAYSARLPASFETFRKRRSAAFFADTFRRLRRLSGEVAEPEFRQAGTVAAGLQILGALVRQKTQRGHALVARPECLAFYRMMTERHLDSGLVSVSAFEAGGAIVATHWGMVFRKRFYYLLLACEFDRWVRYSVGRLLLLRLVQDSIGRGVEVFDLTIGNETYKRFWADRITPLYAYRHALSSRGRLYLALRGTVKGAEKLGRQVRKLPPESTPLSLGG